MLKIYSQGCETHTYQNRAPVAVDDAITLNEDNTARFNPLFNDTDADGEDRKSVV